MVGAALVGGGIVGGLLGKSGAPSVDPSVGAAQQQMADLATRQEDYYENTIAPASLAAMQQQAAVSKETSDADVAAQTSATTQANALNARYWNTEVPLQDQLINQAKDYDTTANANHMAGQAGADVEQALGTQQTGLMQSLRARGIDLGSGSAVSAMTEMNTQAALAKAGAMTKTRDTAQQMGWTRLGEATALGQGLPSFGASSSSLALGASNAANTAAASGTNGVASAAGVGTGNTSTLGGIYNASGQLGTGIDSFNANVYGTSANNNPMTAMAGTAAGYGMSYLGNKYSDSRLKKNIVRLGSTPRGNPTYRWDWITGGSDTGVIAQEVLHIPGAVSVGDNGFLAVDYSKV